MCKVIMIFGAGINQLNLILCAKEMGITTVVIDPQPNPIGRKNADFFYQIAPNDYKLTKEIAIKHNISVHKQFLLPLEQSKAEHHLRGLETFHRPLIIHTMGLSKKLN